MKNVILLFFSFLLFSCGKNDNVAKVLTDDKSVANTIDQSNNALDKNINANAIEKLAKSDTFIDFPVENFYKYNIVNGISAADAIKVRAITYRIMSHVQLTDNQYIFSSKSGKELGVSEDIYIKFKTDFENNNKWIIEQKSKGAKLSLPNINDKYLNALLNKKS